MLAIFLDIETTGLDPRQHAAIDLALALVDISSNVIMATYQSLIAIEEEIWHRADPQSLAINGYTWHQVCQGYPPKEVAQAIISLLSTHKVMRGQSVFICQNPSFDRAFFSQLIDVYQQEKLQWPYHWLDLASMYWALETYSYKNKQIPFPTKLSLSKDAIAAQYNLEAEATPHIAINGLKHLMSTYQAVLNVTFTPEGAS